MWGLCVSQCVGSPKFLSPRSPVARQTHAIANHRYTHLGPRPIVVFVNVERVRSLAPARRLGRLLLSASLDHGMGVCVCEGAHCCSAYPVVHGVKVCLLSRRRRRLGGNAVGEEAAQDDA